MPVPPLTLAFSISGPLRRADLAGLYERVSVLLEGSAGRIVACDLDGAVADAVTLEALAQLGLAARRHGYRVRLRGASVELRELLEFSGLWGALGG
jgi:ABC-type transporter Mla MlaB component